MSTINSSRVGQALGPAEEALKEELQLDAGVNRLMKMSAVKSISRNLRYEDDAVAAEIAAAEAELAGTTVPTSPSEGNDGGEDPMELMAARDIHFHQHAPTGSPQEPNVTVQPQPQPQPQQPTPTPAPQPQPQPQPVPQPEPVSEQANETDEPAEQTPQQPTNFWDGLSYGKIASIVGPLALSILGGGYLMQGSNIEDYDLELFDAQGRPITSIPLQADENGQPRPIVLPHEHAQGQPPHQQPPSQSGEPQS